MLYQWFGSVSFQSWQLLLIVKLLVKRFGKFGFLVKSNLNHRLKPNHFKSENDAFHLKKVKCNHNLPGWETILLLPFFIHTTISPSRSKTKSPRHSCETDDNSSGVVGCWIFFFQWTWWVTEIKPFLKVSVMINRRFLPQKCYLQKFPTVIQDHTEFRSSSWVLCCSKVLLQLYIGTAHSSSS